MIHIISLLKNKLEENFVCKNDYGGFMKVDGTSFLRNNKGRLNPAFYLLVYIRLIEME